MKFKNRHNPVHKIDGKEVWESRSVAVNCVVLSKIENDLYVLIGKRGKGMPDAVGKWNVPGGYLDWDESGTEAAYREIWEEAGLYIPDQNIIINNLLNPWYVNTYPGENKQNIALRYGCVISPIGGILPKLSDENSEPDEIEELKWVNVNDIDDYDFAFNHDTVIKQYLNLIKK